MTPEEARRIVAASGLKKKVEEKKEYISTPDIVSSLKLKSSTVREKLKRMGFTPKYVVSPRGKFVAYWEKDAYILLKEYCDNLRLPLPQDVDLLTTKEALAILKCSQPTLCRHIQSIRRFVDGRVICYYDKNEVLNLAKLWLKSK